MASFHVRMDAVDIDVRAAHDLLSTAIDECFHLDVRSTGTAIPGRGETTPALALISGSHGQPGARYRLVTERFAPRTSAGGSDVAATPQDPHEQPSVLVKVPAATAVELVDVRGDRVDVRLHRHRPASSTMLTLHRFGVPDKVEIDGTYPAGGGCLGPKLTVSGPVVMTRDAALHGIFDLVHRLAKAHVRFDLAPHCPQQMLDVTVKVHGRWLARPAVAIALAFSRRTVNREIRNMAEETVGPIADMLRRLEDRATGPDGREAAVRSAMADALASLPRDIPDDVLADV